MIQFQKIPLYERGKSGCGHPVYEGKIQFDPPFTKGDTGGFCISCCLTLVAERLFKKHPMQGALKRQKLGSDEVMKLGLDGGLFLFLIRSSSLLLFRSSQP
jgi:hypothetical protein